MSNAWTMQTAMERATNTLPTPDISHAQADLHQAVTPYSTQLGARSARARAEQQLEPGVASAATKMNDAISDVLQPLSGVLGDALGG